MIVNNNVKINSNVSFEANLDRRLITKYIAGKSSKTQATFNRALDEFENFLATCPETWTVVARKMPKKQARTVQHLGPVISDADMFEKSRSGFRRFHRSDVDGKWHEILADKEDLRLEVSGKTCGFKLNPHSLVREISENLEKVYKCLIGR